MPAIRCQSGGGPGMPFQSSHKAPTFDTGARLLTTKLLNSGGTALNTHAYLVNTANQRTRQTRTDNSYVTYT